MSINTRVNKLGKMLPDALVGLVARLAMVTVFWRSVQTKIDGWTFLGQDWKFFDLNQSTFLLFKHEYQVPILPSELAAYMATFGEFFLSICLFLGFATRLSAFGLLIMTAIIQFFVYPDAWNLHIIWAAALLYLMKHGAGEISVDAIFFKQ